MRRAQKRPQEAAAASAPASLQRVDAAADALSSSRSSRNRGDANLNEDALANAAGESRREDPLLLLVEERSFWDQFSTTLIYYWLDDYGIKIPPAKGRDREFIIKKVMNTKGVVRPSAGMELVELQNNFFNRVDEKERQRILSTEGLPGLHKHTGVSASSAVAASRGTPPPPAAASSFSAAAAAAASSPVAKAPLFSLEDARAFATPERPSASDFMQFDSSHPSPATAAAPASGEVDCPHCFHHFLARNVQMYACPQCYCRSDCAVDDPRNQLLVKLGEARAAREQAALAPAAAASSSSGSTNSQSSETLSGASTISKMHDKELQLMLGNPEHPLFGGGRPAPGQSEIITASRLAFGATAMLRPSTILLNTIAAGKLTRAGYAKPIPQQQSLAAATMKVGIDEHGNIVSQSAKDPPTLNSLLEFFNAFLASILPALVNNPHALMQWIGLARTTLCVYESSGSNWPTAARYLDQVLQEKVFSGESLVPLATQVHATVTIAMGNRAQAQGVAAHRPQQQQQQQLQRGGPQAGGAGPNANKHCFDWNNGKCTRSPCNFKHVCGECGGKHATPKGAACPGRAPKAPSSVHTKQSKSKDGARDGAESD